jgi:hypothetical protein
MTKSSVRFAKAPVADPIGDLWAPILAIPLAGIALILV